MALKGDIKVINMGGEGKEAQRERRYIYKIMTDLNCCMAEANTTL